MRNRFLLCFKVAMFAYWHHARMIAITAAIAAHCVFVRLAERTGYFHVMTFATKARSIDGSGFRID